MHRYGVQVLKTDERICVPVRSQKCRQRARHTEAIAEIFEELFSGKNRRDLHPDREGTKVKRKHVDDRVMPDDRRPDPARDLEDGRDDDQYALNALPHRMARLFQKKRRKDNDRCYGSQTGVSDWGEDTEETSKSIDASKNRPYPPPRFCTVIHRSSGGCKDRGDPDFPGRFRRSAQIVRRVLRSSLIFLRAH